MGDLSGENIAFGNFTFILVALFIIALGFSLQQTCAQPFAIALGDLSTGSHRLNLGGSVNSFGTTVGPIIVSLFLFGTGDMPMWTILPFHPLKTLYMIVAAVFALVAIIFAISKLPSGKNDEKFERAAKASRSLLVMTLLILGIITLGHFTDIGKTPLLLAIIVIVIGILFYSNSSAVKNPDGWGAMKYEQLIYGMIGIFVYVGVEVTIDNNFGALLKVPGYLTAHGAERKPGFQIHFPLLGQPDDWTMDRRHRRIQPALKRASALPPLLLPFVAFAVVLFANQLKGQ